MAYCKKYSFDASKEKQSAGNLIRREEALFVSRFVDLVQDKFKGTQLATVK